MRYARGAWQWVEIEGFRRYFGPPHRIREER